MPYTALIVIPKLKPEDEEKVKNEYGTTVVSYDIQTSSASFIKIAPQHSHSASAMLSNDYDVITIADNRCASYSSQIQARAHIANAEIFS